MNPTNSRAHRGRRTIFVDPDSIMVGADSSVQPSFPRMLKARRIRTTALVSLLLIAVIYLLAPSGYVRDFRSSHLVTTSVDHSVDWSRFAYVQYVTNAQYLCNSIMLFERLHTLGTKADKLMMYPAKFRVDDTSDEGRLLLKAKNEYGVKLTPIQVQRRNGGDSKALHAYPYKPILMSAVVTWAESYTKLLAFNQTQYDRVLGLDSDATVLQLMDELFLLPPCPVALPRAYWLEDKEYFLSSQIVLVQPSAMEFARVEKAIASAGPNDFDMEIFNNLYGKSAMIIPHRRYDLLTRAFREDHKLSYLGNEVEEWDPDQVLKEAKFLHFSDWPVPKPWIPNYSLMDEHKPPCTDDGKNCRAQELWLGFYSDFAERRERVCGIKVPPRPN
ncbi:nucleotide-diphospho-sugar transferase [Xylogone sp. PMI_703]|nr:nucleotide-diphospho-sugar transferase [Xylogone sp. PMI_703]